MTRSGSVLKRGAIAGLLGAATVAAWFFGLDLMAGRPFRTPLALGVVMFGGRNVPMPVDATLRIIASYTVVHTVAFILAGWVFVFIAEQLERRPSFLLLAVMTAIVLESVAVVNLAQGAQWSGLSIWEVISANVLAVAVMSAYVQQVHPKLRDKLIRARRAHPPQIRV